MSGVDHFYYVLWWFYQSRQYKITTH